MCICVCVCAYLSRNLISTTLHIFTFRTCIIIANIHVCTCCVCHSCHICQRKGFSPGKQSLSCPLAAEFCTAFAALGCPWPCSKGRIVQGSKHVFVGRRAHKNLSRDLIIQPLPLAKDWQKHFGPQTWLGRVQNFSASPILICFASS